MHILNSIYIGDTVYTRARFGGPFTTRKRAPADGGGSGISTFIHVCMCSAMQRHRLHTYITTHTSENTEPHMLQCLLPVARNIKEVIMYGLMCCVEVHTLTYLHFHN